MRRIPFDKWKHFFVGLLLGIIFQPILYYFLNDRHILATFLNIFLVLAISYGFELFSLITKIGHYDIWDAVAGLLGGLAGIMIFCLFTLV